ncbi:unnamed protein product, partial [Prorocentrum cordatum]
GGSHSPRPLRARAAGVMAPAGPPSLLTVRTVEGKEASIRRRLREGQTVQELRHQVAGVLGLLQVRTRLEHGRVLASNQVVADLLGLSVSEEDQTWCPHPRR